MDAQTDLGELTNTQMQEYAELSMDAGFTLLLALGFLPASALALAVGYVIGHVLVGMGLFPNA